MVHKHILIGLIVGIFYFAINITLISDYGLNWDEPTHYLRGQAFLRYFLTGKTNYRDFDHIRRSLYQTDERGGGTQTFSYYMSQPTGHPPLNGELASAFNLIFYQILGVAGDIESYRMFTLATSSLVVFIVYVFTANVWGTFAAIVSVMALVSYPLFFAESHFNIKDPVSTSFFTMTLFTFYMGTISKKIRWFFISSIFTGFALGTKFNILFLPFILIPWLLMLAWKKKKNLLSGLNRRSIAFPVASFIIIPLIILFISYPALWQDPVSGILKTFTSLKSLGLATQYQPKEFFIFGHLNSYPFLWLIYSSPIVTLLLAMFGIIFVLKKGLSEKWFTSYLITFWFIMPFLRVTIGSVSIYGGLRQIMEFIPAMAILAGIGANYISKKFSIPRVLIFLLYIPIILKLISIHPNENVYFNPLIGGLYGAYTRNFPDWGVTLGSVYQQGINWLNSNAGSDAKLALVRGLHSNIPRSKLRDDINLDNKYFSGSEQKGEYIMEVYDYNWILHVPREERMFLNSLSPIYTVKVDGVPILKIWKNDPEYLQKIIE